MIDFCPICSSDEYSRTDDDEPALWACDECGHTDDGPEVRICPACGRVRAQDCYGTAEELEDGTCREEFWKSNDWFALDCYRLGYELEKARADKAEAILALIGEWPLIGPDIVKWARGQVD